MNHNPALINNRYRVVRELGKGGFGATFLVEDTQLPSGKRFVLKELMPIEHDPQTYTLVKQRFEREAVILEELGGLTTQIPSLAYMPILRSRGSFIWCRSMWKGRRSPRRSWLRV